MKKLIFSFLSAFLFSAASIAQDFPYKTFKLEEMDMKKYEKDTSAHAVVLAEYGKASIVAQERSTPLFFEYHVKIKILDSKAFDKGNIEIPIYKGDNDRFETVTDISGVTFYKDDNGSIQQADLDPKKVYTVNENRYWNNVKFAMPNIRAGCTIEYKYRLESPYLQTFRKWIFQSDIPKIYSEYEVHIPAVYNYNISLRGSLKLTKTNSEVERECFSFYGTKCDCSKITYAISDIPAFIEEDYMTASKNFLSGIYFELSDYTSLNNGTKQKVSKEWKDVDYELKHDDSFGSQLRRKELLKERIAPVIAGKTDELLKAKAIYAYIQKTIKWNKFYSFSSEDGLRKALDNHTGTAADVNLTLITALNAAGINTEPVLLSTRDHGIVNRLYPVITEFDYVIAKVNIGDKSYLLDATDPLLSFGMLPMRCLNDQGRVMNLDKPSYWIDLNTAQREKTTEMLDLTLQENGKLKGTLSKYSTGYAAYEKRNAIKKFNSVDEYVENLDEKLTKVKILKSEINNLDSLDKPLVEVYEVEIDAYDNLNHNRLIFNPFILDRITTNPFKLAERNYPVDWGMPSESRFILTMHLPNGYIIENPPQNTGFAMPNKGGRFIVSYQGDSNSFTFSHVTEFNKSIYNSDEYPYLKELYNKIILSEKTEMIFNKKI